MDVSHFGCITVPLHFLIDFPADYPASAPNIGFSFEFQYRGGASYTMASGRLKSKKVICLDVLGNFEGYHGEWKQSVGSGWTAAYTVTTLLVQLQSVLCDLGGSMSQRERDVTYQSAMRFAEKHPNSMLELLDEEDVREKHQERNRLARLDKICVGEQAKAFAERAGFASRPEIMADFIDLLESMSSSTGASTSCNQVDTNICCFSTGKLYTEAILGVGVRREKQNLATAGELLSQEAFDGGLRQNTNKSPFEFFIPVWINAEHACNSPAWRESVVKSCNKIAGEVYNTWDEPGVLEVFPRLINQLIVEMMRPDADKSEAIATFEAMCNFWRTFRWLVETRSRLQQRIQHKLEGFVSDESQRHKDSARDLGIVLVLYTVFQGMVGCPTREKFVNAYVDENSLRWVMWWQRDGVQPKSGPVFDATKVSREIAMFQFMVVDVVLGDVTKSLEDMESTNCRLPERLEALQTQWRDRKNATKSWSDYFRFIGAARPKLAVDDWIAQCQSRAKERGPQYGGGKGKGFGKGGKNGKGK